MEEMEEENSDCLQGAHFDMYLFSSQETLSSAEFCNIFGMIFLHTPAVHVSHLMVSEAALSGKVVAFSMNLVFILDHFCLLLLGF